MKKQLILHIGHYKTGTTALQIFFSRSRKLLAKHGWDYPDVWAHNAKHSAFAFAILREAGVTKLMYDYSDPTPPDMMWQDLYNHIEKSDADTTLISSEEFMRIGQFPEASRILENVLDRRPDWLDVKVIAYLRQPRHHLRSWYNQLIKMNFPLGPLNGAVSEDIEDIHFDYRRAFEPWIAAAGAENVMIRPYVNDRQDPAALHRDFLHSFDVNLPPEDIAIETDPNPRLDDRILELVRLMQNLEFPRQTIQTIRGNGLSYLDSQDLRAPDGYKPDRIEEARVLASSGLDWLRDQPGCSIPTEVYAQDLPEPVSTNNIEQDLMLGFVYSELIQLRQRVNRMNISDLLRRIEELEQKLEERS